MDVTVTWQAPLSYFFHLFPSFSIVQLRCSAIPCWTNARGQENIGPTKNTSTAGLARAELVTELTAEIEETWTTACAMTL